MFRMLNTPSIVGGLAHSPFKWNSGEVGYPFCGRSSVKLNDSVLDLCDVSFAWKGINKPSVRHWTPSNISIRTTKKLLLAVPSSRLLYKEILSSHNNFQFLCIEYLVNWGCRRKVILFARTTRTDRKTLTSPMSETFDWDYPGLNWSHIHSLANLLSLRNSSQAEPSSLSDTMFEEDWDPDDIEDGDAPSVDTRFAHQISHSGHKRLKRRFLDCLAEFAANMKGGGGVACSTMEEAVDIWINRNEGF